jgi:hypothetical protein
MATVKADMPLITPIANPVVTKAVKADNPIKVIVVG